MEEFNPDLILISAGFDAHRRDELNHGHVQLEEPDYEMVYGSVKSVYQTSVVQVKLCQFWREDIVSGGHVVSALGACGWSSAVTIGNSWHPSCYKRIA